MKDQYAGDFGDFVKLALLRRLSVGRKLAVAWYRTADDPSRADGKHTGYLNEGQDQVWRALDPELYDHLRWLVKQGRSISGLQRILEKPENSFYDQIIESKSSRAPWFALLTISLGLGNDLLFLDPDNGIASPGFSGSTASVTSDEIDYLRQHARTIIIYHHHTRAKGGHLEELKRLAAILAPSHSYHAVCAIRAASWSPRSFLIVAPDLTIWTRAVQFAAAWDKCVSFHALTDPPDHFGLTPGASAYHRVDAMEGTGMMDHAAEQLLRSFE